MKQKILYLALITVISLKVFSQTTTINYSNANLGSNCNVFNPGVNVNSVPHQSHAGGVSYSSGNGISLATYPSGSSVGGTAYVIRYSFATGYNYTVSITARGDNVLYLKATVVPNFNQFNTTSTSSCTPDANVTGYTTVGTGNISAQPPSTSTTYTSQSFSGASQSYLVIWATGGPANLSLDALTISSVVISKTAASPTFTLPATTSVQCGSSPITFTATTASNPANLTITNYTWNLGATPNGWSINGTTPAFQTVSTGTTNSIQLTPTNGTLSNISATVTAGGNNYNTNTTTVSRLAPSLSITGPGSFCTSDNYSLSNLLSGTTVSWSASPAGVVSLSSTGAQVTATRISDGTFNLTATVTTPCSTYTTSLNSITVGSTNAWSGNIAIDNYDRCTGTTQWAVTTDLGAGSSYQWYVNPGISGTDYYMYNGGYEASFNFYTPGNYQIDVRATSSCGHLYSASTSIQISNCWQYYMVSPNPATSDITVSVDEERLKQQKIAKSAEQSIQKIIIMDKMGTALVQRSYSPDTRKVSLPVSGLSSDMYVVKIFNGKQWTSVKFLKK